MRNRDKPAKPAAQGKINVKGGVKGKHVKVDQNGVTKLEDLAMQLYVSSVSQDIMIRKDSAKWAIESANIFFDELDKDNG